LNETVALIFSLIFSGPVSESHLVSIVHQQTLHAFRGNLFEQFCLQLFMPPGLNVADQHECLLVEMEIRAELGQLEVVPEPGAKKGTVEPFRFQAKD